jgi:ABC-type glycerol-3-phosphate transport system substrate-binding protein
MSQISPSKPRRQAPTRWRRLTAALAIASLVALAGGASAATADTPTAPPPVTVLTHGNVGNGDFFV